MKITKLTIYYIETEANFYTRYSEERWEIATDNGNETVYDKEVINYLEKIFQNWLKEQDNE